MGAWLRAFLKPVAPQALRLSSRAYTYRFYLSAVLTFLVLLSVMLDHSLLGIFILALLAMAFCCDVFVACGLKDLSNRRISFAGMCALGCWAGFFYSAYNTFSTRPLSAPTPELYIYVLFVLTLYLWAQRSLVRLSEKAHVFIKKIEDFLPKSARRLVQEGQTKKVFSGELKQADLILIKRGERIPADGIIEKGESFIGEELVNGSSYPTFKKAGDAVFAGTLNKSAALTVRITQPLSSSVIMGVMEAIKAGEKRREKIKSPLDANAWWLLSVMLLAAAAAGIYVSHRGPAGSFWQPAGIILWTLGVACPAGLVFCTVFPVFFLRWNGRRKQVKVRNIDALGRIVNSDVFFFDKSGLVTADKNGEELRPGVEEAVRFLQAQGKELVLVSGDARAAVQRIADQVGIEKFNFEVLPNTKAEIISNLRALGKKITMVSGGVNDVIALLRADGGIVFSCQHNVYNGWVDVLARRQDLYPLVYLFKIKRGLRRITFENFILASGLHVVLAGYLLYRLPPGADWQWPVGGSLLVVLVLFLNSMRMLRIK